MDNTKTDSSKTQPISEALLALLVAMSKKP